MNTSLGITVRSDVPPSVHPAALGNLAPTLDKDGTIGRAALAEAQDALGTAYRTLGSIAEAEKALERHAKATTPGNRRQTPDGRTAYLGDIRMVDGKPRRFTSADEEFAAAADAAITRACQTIDRRVATLDRHKAALEARVQEALRPAAPLPVLQEVRAFVRGLPDADRTTFLTSAAQAGDRDTVGAVLSGPLYLSGISDELAETVRATAAKALAPIDWDQLAAVRAAIEMVGAAGGRLVVKVGELERYRSRTGAAVGRATAEVRKMGAANA